jgi:hypothetical protein
MDYLKLVQCLSLRIPQKQGGFSRENSKLSKIILPSQCSCYIMIRVFIMDTSTKMVYQKELASRNGKTATNTVENSNLVVAMELLKQSTLTAIFAGERSKTIKQMDIIHFSGRMETHSLGSSKMEIKKVMANTDGLTEEHITGCGIKV